MFIIFLFYFSLFRCYNANQNKLIRFVCRKVVFDMQEKLLCRRNFYHKSLFTFQTTSQSSPGNLKNLFSKVSIFVSGECLFYYVLILGFVHHTTPVKRFVTCLQQGFFICFLSGKNYFWIIQFTLYNITR